MTVIVDEAKCIGAGACVMAAPDIFDQRDEDGVAVVLKTDLDASDALKAKRAVSACPARAIALV